MLNTESIFCDITKSSITKKGAEHDIIEHLEYTPAALCKAKQRMPDNLFKNIQKEVVNNYLQSSRIFAIDGSKFYVPKSFKYFGFKSRTNDKNVPRKAKRPIAMLSSMVDVYENIVCDYVISKHFNERNSALVHLKVMKPGDTAIFDRGYFSSELYTKYNESGVFSLFRLKKDQFRAVKQFVSSNHTDKIVTTMVGDKLFKIRLIKYKIDDKEYIIGTSLFDLSKQKIADLYKKRWNVELSFRRLKSNLNLNYTFTLKENTWHQAVQARLLADTVSLMLNDQKRPIQRLNNFIKRKRLKDTIYLINQWQLRVKYSYETGKNATIYLKILELEIPP